MSKELEALERLKTAPTFMGGTVEYQACTKSETLLMQDYEIVKQALLRLQSIDNANPSEAIECLERIEADLIGLPKHVTEYDNIFDDYLYDIENNIDTLKQALIKQQEPKQYLKWEDLDKFEEQKDFFGLLNGNKYTLWWYRDSRNKYVMINLNEINIVTLCDMFKQDIDFFNDLHLERVEE